MIVVELSFEATNERIAARPAHREILQSLAKEGVLHLAGPWDDDTGALLVFDATTTQVDDVLRRDPYYRTAGVAIRSVRQWNPIAGDPDARRSHP